VPAKPNARRARLEVLASYALVWGLVLGVWHLATSEHRVNVLGFVGQCSTALAASHPGGCSSIRSRPSMLLVSTARNPRTFTLSAGPDRGFRAKVPAGRYDVFVVAMRGSLIGAGARLAHSVRIDRDHPFLGTVAPAEAWKWSGRSTIALG
jgi:hypothetical protein